MNETGMSSAEWHRFNGHLKFHITEGMVSIECKVCFNVSSRCRGNTAYFKQLGKVLVHPDIVAKPNRTLLYQKYLEWCENNGEKPFPNNTFDKKLLEKNIIECKQVRVEGGKKEWQYILDRSKIIAKLREFGLGDMEKFSDTLIEDTPQLDLLTNEVTDIPIFNIPEIIPLKIILPQPEENLPLRDKKVKPPIASISEIFKSSKTSEYIKSSNKKAFFTFLVR
ncbi:hypothetical protein GLOIN_2v1877063 [Rhizophagus clarus]|uniref:DNA primase/nucleoside triphosphatase C-terminal domain-containing protein n=1 Tax=Rhizophagus clarus TaxID=94130 RepID=A0A8H3LZQ7_9GLOM|nr:hypothetical protein GLOIN_2v1877063 [Rhizophagus clarus]